jgi:hypothetical protein
MKERELIRIADEKVQQDLAKTIITAHNETLRTDRVVNVNERFTITRPKLYDADSNYNQSKILTGPNRFGYAPAMTGGKSEIEL